MYRWLLTCLLLGVQLLWAQDFTFQNSVSVTRNGNDLAHAWAGGFNSPQWSQADLNEDGLLDLFVFDRSDETVSIFFGQKRNDSLVYVFQPNYLQIHPLPRLKSWALLREMNGDGIPDLVTSNRDQYLIYYFGKRENQLLTFENQARTINYIFRESENGKVISSGTLSMPPGDISGIADMDFDGDTDFLVNAPDGSRVQFYRNYAVERFGRKDTFDLELVSICWGHFAEIYDGNSYDVILHQEPCPVDYKTSDVSHFGGTLTPVNLNGDTLMDVVISDAGLDNMIALINGGNRKIAHISDKDNRFPNTSEPVDISYFPAAFFLDVNQDKKLDFIASPNELNTGEDVDVAWYYENISDNDTVNFQIRRKDFLVNEMMDVGRGAVPVVWDYNRDGLPDLVVANRSKFINATSSQANLALYKNVGTPSQPAFEWQTDALLTGLPTPSPLALTPAFGDLDHDGDDDLLIGELARGWVSYWENVSQPNDLLPKFAFRERNYLKLPNILLIESAPCLTDWDGDRDLDLLVGTGHGTIFYYENTGNLRQPRFTLQTEKMGNLSVKDSLNPLLGRVYPFMADGNGDGIPELWVSNASGKMYVYPKCADVKTTFQSLDSFFTERPLGINLKATFFGKDLSNRLQLIFGTERGGLLWASLRQRSWVTDTALCKMTIPPDNNDFFANFACYPNPATDRITLELPASGQLTIYNSLGQKMESYTLTRPTETIVVSAWSAGVYVFRLETEGQVYLRKVVIL
jgi:hypothetical protein